MFFRVGVCVVADELGRWFLDKEWEFENTRRRKLHDQFSQTGRIFLQSSFLNTSPLSNNVIFWAGLPVKDGHRKQGLKFLVINRGRRNCNRAGLTASKAPRRKTIERIETVFMAVLSLLLASARTFELWVTSMFSILSLWARKLYVCSKRWLVSSRKIIAAGTTYKGQLCLAPSLQVLEP